MIDYIAIMITGILIFAAGFAACYITCVKPKNMVKNDELSQYKKVIKPSYKSPLRQQITTYEKYKGDDGLYNAVKPNRNQAPKKRGEG